MVNFLKLLFIFSSFLLPQHSHKQAVPCPGDQIHKYDKVGLCCKFFLPSPNHNLVTFKYTTEILSCLSLCIPLWPSVKALAHRSSLSAFHLIGCAGFLACSDFTSLGLMSIRDFVFLSPSFVPSCGHTWLTITKKHTEWISRTQLDHTPNQTHHCTGEPDTYKS